MYNLADFMHFVPLHTCVGGVSIDSIFQENIFVRLMNKLIRFDFKPKFELLPEKHSFHFVTEIDVYLLGKLIINDILYSYKTDGPYLAHWEINGSTFNFVKLRVTTTLVPEPGRKFCFTMYHYCEDTYLARIISVLLMRFEGSMVISHIFKCHFLIRLIQC